MNKRLVVPDVVERIAKHILDCISETEAEINGGVYDVNYENVLLSFDKKEYETLKRFCDKL